ncbi:MAG: alpha/beta hydrolase [Gemmataceae bacterium]
MPRKVLLALMLLAVWPATWAVGINVRPNAWRLMHKLDRHLCGTLLDFTHNHGGDYRIPAPSLCDRRDLYVYLPPCYDPHQQYPVLLYLHGIAQDEVGFLQLVPMIDRAIVRGELPPMIIAAPDGTTRGSPSVFNAGSFYINSKAGRFHDYIVNDVWNFVCSNFPIRPEREYHVIAGASMGGFGAYNIAIQHRDQFSLVAGIFPPLHLRYCDCHGRYFANYDPNCLGTRERLSPFQPIARFYGGVITIRQGQVTRPLFGIFNPDALQEVAKINPYEMLDTYCVQPGELEMFVGYGKHDQFNIDAQVEAFADKARCRGLSITCVCDPNGRHDTATGERLFPAFCRWLSPLLTCPPHVAAKPQASP